MSVISSIGNAVKSAYNSVTGKQSQPSATYTTPSGNVYRDEPGFTRIVSAPSPTAGYSSNPAIARAQNQAQVSQAQKKIEWMATGEQLNKQTAKGNG